MFQRRENLVWRHHFKMMKSSPAFKRVVLGQNRLNTIFGESPLSVHWVASITGWVFEEWWTSAAFDNHDAPLIRVNFGLHTFLKYSKIAGQIIIDYSTNLWHLFVLFSSFVWSGSPIDRFSSFEQFTSTKMSNGNFEPIEISSWSSQIGSGVWEYLSATTRFD